MKIERRSFLTLLGGAVTAWPLEARAQQPRERMRRVGVLMNVAADDAEALPRATAFVQGLQEANWTDGRNVKIDWRWSAGDSDRARRFAVELVAFSPDVILTAGGLHVGLVLQVTRSVPIVFVGVTDPVGAGRVSSLARPGGNVTGFTNFEYGITGKWLELLKTIAPDVTRVGVVRDPSNPGGTGQFGALQALAPFLRVEVSPIDVRDSGEIERAVSDFARVPHGGLIVVAGSRATASRDLLITLAARLRLPAVYSGRHYVTSGGLISYAPDVIPQYRQAAGYVDRILRGEKPADLPVQAPVKYETVLNLKTARALGLDVPTTVLVRADEVIE